MRSRVYKVSPKIERINWPMTLNVIIYFYRCTLFIVATGKKRVNKISTG